MSLRIAMLIGLLAVVAAGCVRRTIHIETEPAGAIVYLNDEEVGRSPLTVPFTWYGVYDVRLERAGYQTLHTSQRVDPPWHEHPGPDLVVELLPWETRVSYDWRFDLSPDAPVDPEDLVGRARELQADLNGPPSAEEVDSAVKAAPRPSP